MRVIMIYDDLREKMVTNVSVNVHTNSHDKKNTNADFPCSIFCSISLDSSVSVNFNCQAIHGCDVSKK